MIRAASIMLFSEARAFDRSTASRTPTGACLKTECRTVPLAKRKLLRQRSQQRGNIHEPPWLATNT